MRAREGTGKAQLIKGMTALLDSSSHESGGGGGVGAAGAGAGAGVSTSSGRVDTLTATSAQPEKPFPVVLRMAEEVVRHCTELPAGGVLGSAFKVAYRNYHGIELQLKFLGQRVQLKDILERSRVIERIIVNTQPLYRYRGVVSTSILPTPPPPASAL